MTSLFLAGAGEKQSLICQEFEQAIENSSVLARVVETEDKETANRNLQKSMIKWFQDRLLACQFPPWRIDDTSF